MKHDQWSKMGEEHLGEANLNWVKKMDEMHMGPPGYGSLTLMKAIMNDYWADIPGGTNKHGWTADHVDMVMSKLYWCWVAWLEASHQEVGDDE